MAKVNTLWEHLCGSAYFTSWSIDGTGSVSITKTYTGTMGITYRTRVVVTTGVDKIDATSTERTV
jgi:hypothetical protein